MKNKVLNFNKNADYYFNRHLKAFDEGDLLTSLSNIRCAIEKDPKNDEYKLSLAETLCEMGNYEESNYVLFGLLEKGEKFSGDVVFDIAVNLFNLGDYAKAKETFYNFIEEYPQSDRLEDAQDAYELICDDLLCGQNEPVKDVTLESANKGKQLLDEGRFDEAIKIMQPIAKNNPQAAFLQNNLALAYFCSGDKKNAIEISKAMFERQPKNVHTICNLAIFHSHDEPAKAKEYCELLDDIETENEADLHKMLLTYCEVGLHEKVYDTAQKLLDFAPYDNRLIFIYAAACSNLGKLAKAIDAYVKILKIDPKDTVAQYYKNKIQRIFDADPYVCVLQEYTYEVPLSEIHERLNYLHRQSARGELNMRLLWTGDEYFSSLLVWGLYFSDPDIKRACAQIIAAFNDERSNEILRRYLMDSSEPDEIKNEIFVNMNKIGYKQPYLSYINGKLAEVRVGAVNSSPAVANENEDLLKLISKSELILKEPLVLSGVISILDKYLNSEKPNKKFLNKEAWAAAFIYCALKDNTIDNNTLYDILKEEYGVSSASLSRCIRLINNAIGEKDEK